MMFWLSGTVISSGIGCEPFQLLCLECVRMQSKMLDTWIFLSESLFLVIM